MREIKIIFKIGLLSLVASAFLPLGAVESVEKTTATPAFTANIVGTAFDRYTGTFYLQTSTAGVNDTTKSIAKAGRTDVEFTALAPAATQKFQASGGLAANITANRQKKPLFGLLRGAGNEATHLTTMTAIADDTTPDADSTKKLYTIKLSDNGATVGKSAKLLLTNGTDITPAGAATGLCLATGVQRTAANAFLNALAFVRVYPAGGDGVTLSGVACAKLNTATDTLDKTAANAVALAVDTAELAVNVAPQTAQVEDMWWNEDLQVLYVAMNTVIGATDAAAGHGAIGIMKAVVADDATGVLQAFAKPIAQLPVNTVTPGANTASDFVFIAKQTAVLWDPPAAARINKIRSMKTSTEKHYLITCGGAGSITEADVKNDVRALRLDGTRRSGNIVQNDTTGTALAVDWTAAQLNATKVGGGLLPFTSAADVYISDMDIVGDTVYVSFADTARGAADDPGIWSSTAMFDADGVINGWTAWERVCPDNATAINQRVEFFAVDAQTNKLWKVRSDATGFHTVERMAWATSGFGATTLPGALNATFGALTHTDVTCTLDLPLGTLGIAGNANPDNSLILFGGYEKVVFARTKKGTANAIVTDFSAATDYNDRTTSLAGAGTVRCLGFSRNNEDLNNGYFLAGTDNGLWMFYDATNNHGFNGSGAATYSIINLNAYPFDANAADPNEGTAHTWHRMVPTQITGPVTAIESDGTYIYVIEQDVTSTNGITSKLWRIAINAAVGTMFDTGHCVLIAQSGKDEIPTNTLFTGFKFFDRGTAVQDNNGVAGILSTNQGLFFPTCYMSALNSVDSALLNPNRPNHWDAIADLAAYKGLYTPKIVPTTSFAVQGRNTKIWAVSYADAANSYFQNSKFHQYGTYVSDDNLNLSTDRTGENVINYTNTNMATDTDTLTYLDRSTNFWTDGARRFFTGFDAAAYVSEGADYTMLRSLPYNAQEWNMTAPYQVADVAGKGIYWIENISGLGIILAGTTNGVISLE